MRLPLTALAVLGTAAFAPRSGATLQDALLAHQVLTPVAEACVVRIDFAGARPREPIFATAFALEKVLWLYAPEFGTFALGPATGPWPDPALASTHLRLLEADVARINVYPNPVPPTHRLDQHYLVDACVISSLGALTWALAHESDLSDAGLILMSYDNSAVTLVTLRINHCLLAYRSRGNWWCVDPNNIQQPFALEHVAVGSRLDPALTALALKQHYPLKGAYFLSFSPATLARITATLQWKSVTPANKTNPFADP